MNLLKYALLAASFITVAHGMEESKQERSVKDLLESNPHYPFGPHVCDLSGENLTSIEGIEGFKRIKEHSQIILDDNHIRLEGSPFRHLGLTACHVLTLNRNNITELNPSFFEGLPSLTQLELQDNKLKALPANLGSLTQLKFLALTGNTQLTREQVLKAQKDLPNTDIY